MSISAGIGLISGIDTATLIDQLISLQAIPKTNLQLRLANLQTQQSALLDINARLLNLKTTAGGLRTANVFESITTPSTDDSVLTASPIIGGAAQPGSYSFLVKQLVSSSQKLSRGFTDTNSSPVGLTQLSFELGNGAVVNDTQLADLNADAGVARGKITIKDTDDNTATIDLTTATTLGEVLTAINNNSDVKVTASVDGDRLVVTDTAGGVGGPLTIGNEGAYTTATDLGIDVAAVGNVITGENIRTIGGVTPLSSLNDGNGVLLVSANPDITIITRDGAQQFDIDFGRINAAIDGDTLIEDLNSGQGITTNPDSEEDLKFVDRLGDEHLVDLTGIVTVQDFMDRVFDQTNGDIFITVTDGDKITVNDGTGSPTGLLKVLGAGALDEQTAEDLGILEVVGVDAASFNGDIIVNADHTPAAATIQQLIDRINNAKDTLGGDNLGHIVASLAADGVSLQIDDTGGVGANLIVTSTITNPSAARDLGIDTGTYGVDSSTIAGDRLIAGLDSVLMSNLSGGSGVSGVTRGLSGESLLADLLAGAGISTTGDGLTDMRMRNRNNDPWVNLDLDSMTTVQELIDAVDAGSGGTMTLEIDGGTLVARDHTLSTANNFRIRDRNGATAATDLGLEGGYSTDIAIGDDLDPIPTRSFDITDRNGATQTITLVDPKSIGDVITAINNAGLGVVATANDAGSGLLITDTTGATVSNLIVTDTAGTMAADLGIAGDVAADSIRGDNLQLRYVSEATLLSDLNYGRGIATGTFRITDGDGDQVIIDIDSQKTVYELLQEINGQAASANVDVIARVNDNGDGIVLENTLLPVPAGLIKVESISGTTADDLRIKGQATTEGGSIDGSYEATIAINASDTVTEIIQAVNDAGIPVNATVLNTGVGATPFKMVFSSEVTGTDGKLLIDDDGFGLNVTTLTEAQDAKVFFGNADPTKATLVQRSTNSLTDVLQGVTVDLVSASDSPVSVNISRDNQTIEDKIGEFVAAFNDSIQRIDQYDFFNVETESRGPLLGNSTTAQVRGALIRVAQGKADGVQSQFQFLSQVGIRIGAGSTMTFDRTRFQEALDEDYDAVVNLFTAFESSTTTTRQIEEGVTITVNDQTFAELGFADLFDQLLDGLTNSIDGTVTIADQSFQSQIDLTNSRIENFDERLDAKRLVLERQFTAMEVALAGLQAQQNGLLSLINNLALSQASLS